MSIRWWSQCLVVDFVFATALLVVPFVGATDWPQHGYDAAHTGFNPHEGILGPLNVGDLEVLWRNYSPCTIREGVSVSDGVVYYGHYCGEFRAVDAENGSLLWERSLDGKDVGQAVADGVAYVASIGAVYAFDAASGALVWSWDPEPLIWEGPVLANGIVYVYTEDSTLHALAADGGSELGSVSPGGLPAVSEGIVYDSTDALRAYSAGSLTLLWTGFLETGSNSYPGRRPVVANGYVYVQSDAGYMEVFAAGGCGEEVCSPLWRAYTQVQAQRDAQPPAVGEGRVFMGANSTFYAFPADGCGAYECDPLWIAGTDCTFFAEQPSIANGVVYSVCGTSDLYAFDTSTGDVLWRYHTPTGYPMRSPPVIVDGRLYHDATFDFTLYAFHLPGAGMLGVDTEGMKPGVWGLCANTTTGESIWIFDNGTTSMDCRAAGLDAAEDDVIVLIIRGLAE